MFGVLVVRSSSGRLGYLAAFSGLLAGHSTRPGFVPPLLDLYAPGSFFPREAAHISDLNRQITELESSSSFMHIRDRLAAAREGARQRLRREKEALKAAKNRRREFREKAARSLDPCALAALEEELARERLHLQCGYKRLARGLQADISTLEESLAPRQARLALLLEERQARSLALQEQVFDACFVRNARGASRTVAEIFVDNGKQRPPSGTGDCAAPRLLQYAFSRGLRPLALAEFWWGTPPPSAVRRQGAFYPPCRGRCRPLLGFMLQGMDVDVEAEQEQGSGAQVQPITTIYEDEAILVINKPPALLSVPGKEIKDSVYARMRARYPAATGPLLVHRLDMATSGLLLIAKSLSWYQHLQDQFARHRVRKTYVAIVDGLLTAKRGIIDLPLRPDPDDRPRQLVCVAHGKPAVTTWEVVEYVSGRTRVCFFPETGRTHQLRVHAAHHLGLQTPIVGDSLYGRKADRLYLHAAAIEFVHPQTGQAMRVESSPRF